MAIQISFTDRRGVANTQAYVRVYDLHINFQQKICDIQLAIFHNAAARSKADEAQIKQFVHRIDYKLWGTTFDTYLADSVIQANGKSLLGQIYTWLKQHKDLADIPSDDRFNHGNNIDWTTATDV